MRHSILVNLVSLIGLVACSPVYSIKVNDFSVPIANTLGQICWVEVDNSGSPQVRTATYAAQAAYAAGIVEVTESVNVQFYGRVEKPGGGCTTREEAVDRELSHVFELSADAQRIEVGGAAYGPTLAAIANAGVFWLGASAQGNVGVGEELRFTQGRLSVGL